MIDKQVQYSTLHWWAPIRVRQPPGGCLQFSVHSFELWVYDPSMWCYVCYNNDEIAGKVSHTASRELPVYTQTCNYSRQITNNEQKTVARQLFQILTHKWLDYKLTLLPPSDVEQKKCTSVCAWFVIVKVSSDTIQCLCVTQSSVLVWHNPFPNTILNGFSQSHHPCKRSTSSILVVRACVHACVCTCTHRQ